MPELKILVYVDRGTRGRWALSLARELAHGLRARVILLTAERNLKIDPGLLEKAAADLEPAIDREPILRTRPGPARKAILEESLASSPAVTIFPPAGRRGLARMLKGSRVKTVVHNSPSTVAVARKPVHESISRILVTISGGPMSETTLLSACEVAGALNSELTVLHVTSSIPIPHAERVEAGADESTPEVGRLVDDLPPTAGRKPELRLRTGMVVPGILDECRRGHYDLLILGQHLAVREAGSDLSQNIADLLAVECPIPVLIVRPRRWAAGSRAGGSAMEE